MALTPKKEDWKKIRQQVKLGELGEPTRTLGKGDGEAARRVLLEEGTRRSLSTRDEEPMNRGRLLGMMEERLRRRKINRKAPKSINITPYEKRLKGLFGSDD